ncbi:MAG: AAA family ATPase [Paludibacteraceae bacterium]|nr:AAA family ATPase [Bacteroidales bacterium]MDY4149323.1 AAA family ATPase [Paludibacteraceae bacterium]
MILNLGSLAFNANIQAGGGTPAWGTELGQGEGYRFQFEDAGDFLTSMLYMSVDDKEQIYCPLGKGSGRQNDYEIVIGSLYDKVFVNGIKIPDAKFILLIVRQICGGFHIGRRTLKYNPRMTYHDKAYNADCYKRIPPLLGIAEDAAWFIDEIYTENQDELHFVAYVLDANEVRNYQSNEERKKDFLSKIETDKIANRVSRRLAYKSDVNHPLQQIFYGAPGTGKSYRIKEIVEHYPKENIFRTTFHPDSDYSTFVGCYKPTKVKKPVRDMAGKTALDDKKNEIFEDAITYSFVPQAFLKAYIRAWNLLDSGQLVFLIIEEINRGNCAQIFGDLFQLLDRRQDGYSVYPIKADTDLAQYLNGTDNDGNDILTNREGITDGELNLPPNLYIWGTMNTSDQSLFPIDSAFKRRWNWKYIKISDAKLNWGIQYVQDDNSWYAFIEQINKIIIQITNSADKQLGYFFCQPDSSQDGKPAISLQRFVDKVVFYLWNDVFKDNTFGDTNLFMDDRGNAISFPDFYDNTDEVNKPTTLAFIRRVMQWGKSSAELQQDSE